MFQVVDQAGICPDFQHMARALLYSRPTSSVSLQGRASEAFDVGHGVHQGCPLSPAPYVLAFEPLFDLEICRRHNTSVGSHQALFRTELQTVSQGLC